MGAAVFTAADGVDPHAAFTGAGALGTCLTTVAAVEAEGVDDVLVLAVLLAPFLLAAGAPFATLDAAVSLGAALADADVLEASVFAGGAEVVALRNEGTNSFASAWRVTGFSDDMMFGSFGVLINQIMFVDGVLPLISVDDPRSTVFAIRSFLMF
jgi:hypothetical protein